MPPPEPPSVKLGRITAGKPTVFWIARASSRVCAAPERADSRPISLMIFLKRSRSSALSIASGVAPISSTS